MMEHRLFEHLNSRQLPTGRRLFVLKAIRKLAEAFGDASIVAKCDRALATDEACLRTEMDYRMGKSLGSNARGLAVEYDRQIDTFWGGIYAIAQGQTVGSDAVAGQADEFLQEVFPDGLIGLVRLSFEEQLANMDLLLARFDANTGDLAAVVDALGVRRHVTELTPLVEKFRAELEKEAALRVTYAQVKDAQRDGLDTFAAATFAVLSTYDTDSAQDTERRAALLAEYYRQNAIVADSYRRNKRAPDVDPDTGEPLADAAAEPVA